MPQRPHGRAQLRVARRAMLVVTCACLQGGLGFVTADRPAAATVAAAPAAVSVGEAAVTTPTLTAPLAMDRLDRAVAGRHVAVSVVSLDDGERVVAGERRGFRTASLIKVHLAALLLRGPKPTKSEQVRASDMITVSDNSTASAVYDRLGGADGVDRRLDQAFGIDDVRVGRAGAWGDSRLTATSMTRLLTQIFGPAGRDDDGLAALRRYMRRVVPEHRFGVSVVADNPRAVPLKNGWLPESDGWIVTSAGQVTIDGRRYVMAVLTDRQRSKRAGERTVESVSRLAIDAIQARQRPSAIDVPVVVPPDLTARHGLSGALSWSP